MEQDQYQRHQGSAAYTTSHVKSPSIARLRHRQRTQSSSTFNTVTSSPFTPGNLRRSSTFSEAVSETRRSIQASTDDLFFPRANESMKGSNSPWHSSPLVFALLPALGGLLFQNGTSVFTDVSLLALAAVFLNWSVRLPWDWYFSAQEQAELGSQDFDFEDSGSEYQEAEDNKSSEKAFEPSPDGNKDKVPRAGQRRKDAASKASRARHELHIHELAALASCFLFPVLAAYLLHNIRSQLSRPSEGLISNYNLTLFLLAAEIRPISHLLRMVQSRTLYLQRVVESNRLKENSERAASLGLVLEISRRLEELEARFHAGTSKSILAGGNGSGGSSFDEIRESVLADIWKSIKGDMDTYSQVARKQEKRCNVAIAKLETQLQFLDCYIAELDPLIATAKQEKARGSKVKGGLRYSSLLRNVVATLTAVIGPPLHFVWKLATLPTYPVLWAYNLTTQLLGLRENLPVARRIRTKRPSRRESSVNVTG